MHSPPLRASRPHLHFRAGPTVAGALLVVLAVLAVGQSTIRFPASSVDPSYQMALNWAVLHGAAFGREIIYTFGPLGFLHVWMFDPALAPVHLAFALALGFLVAANLWHLGGSGRGAAGMVVVLAVALGALQDPDARFLFVFGVLALTTLVPRPAEAPGWLVVANAGLLGVLSLMKFTFLIAGTGLAMLLTAREFWAGGGRRALVVAVTWALTFGGLWWATGGDAASLPTFLWSGVTQVARYSAAMSASGAGVREMMAFALAAAAFVLATLVRREAPIFPRMLQAAALVGVFGIAFKNAYVRQRFHFETATAAAAALGLLVVVALWRESSRFGRACLLVGGVAAGVCVWWSPRGPVWQGLTPAGFAAVLDQRVDQLRDALGGWPDATRAWTDRIRWLRTAHTFPLAAGSMDVLANSQYLLLANGADWRPRPIFQAYAAIDAELQHLNAERLARDGARTLIADLGAIDGRPPMLEQGPSTLALLAWYDVAGEPGEFLRLERRATPRTVQTLPAGVARVRLGQRVAVPSSGLVWVRIDVPLSARGRVAEAALRVPPVSLVVHLASGEQRRFRLVPDMARAGFLLSPLVTEPNGLGELLAGRAADGLRGFEVAEVAVVTEGPWAYGSTAEIEFARVEWVPKPVSRPPDPPTSALSAGVLLGLYDASASIDGAWTKIEPHGPDAFAALPFLAPSRADRLRTVALDVDLGGPETVHVLFRGLEDPFGHDRSIRFQLPAGRSTVHVPLPTLPQPIQLRVGVPGGRAPFVFRARVEPQGGPTPPLLSWRDVVQKQPTGFLVPLPGPRRARADRFFFPALVDAPSGARLDLNGLRAVNDVAVEREATALRIRVGSGEGLLAFRGFPRTTRRRPRTAQVGVESSTPETFRLAVAREGDPITAGKPIVVQVPPGRHVIQAALLPGRKPNVLRIAPCARACDVRLEGVWVGG